MKKIFLILVLFASLTTFSQRQINVGVNGGVTIGNIESVSSFALGFDVNYLFDWFEDFKIGPSLSGVYFSTKSEDGVKIDSPMYLPIGGAIRFQTLEDAFYVGTDLGYAIGISPSGDRGGIYFKPMVGYNIDESFKVNLFYSAIKKKQPAYSYIGLGIVFNVLGNESNGYSY